MTTRWEGANEAGRREDSEEHLCQLEVRDTSSPMRARFAALHGQELSAVSPMLVHSELKSVYHQNTIALPTDASGRHTFATGEPSSRTTHGLADLAEVI
jgi:hypothetical protein